MTTESEATATSKEGYDENGDPIVKGIVSATGTIVLKNKSSLGKAIEAAMIKATLDCAAEGITDSDTIRERKLAAREQVKADHAKAMADQAEARKRMEEEASTPPEAA
jgi:hypothetical protein